MRKSVGDDCMSFPTSQEAAVVRLALWGVGSISERPLRSGHFATAFCTGQVIEVATVMVDSRKGTLMRPRTVGDHCAFTQLSLCRWTDDDAAYVNIRRLLYRESDAPSDCIG